MKIKIEASHLQNLKDDLERAEVMNEDLSERLERAEAEIEYLKAHLLAYADEAKFEAMVAEALSNSDDVDCLLPCAQQDQPDRMCDFTMRPTCSACRLMTARIVAEEWMDEKKMEEK